MRDNKPSLEEWLLRLEQHFEINAPELLSLYTTYAEETRFGYEYIRHDLALLNESSQILEIGSGSMMLSCYLASGHFQVTALEPVEQGFSHFHKMQSIVIDLARSRGHVPTILKQSAESLSIENTFDFAFSVNVMEHVESPDLVLLNIVKSIKSGSTYKFTCPNYLFPYEPHFNIPTLFNKLLTWKVMKRQILSNAMIDDAIGTWESLNWITPYKIRKACRQIQDVDISFNKRIFSKAISRIQNDPAFSARRSTLIQKLANILYHSGIYRLFDHLPVSLMPLIDCSINKKQV